MVQGEAGLEGDRPLIASVIDNRLRDGMPLQIDATVLYALQERKPSNTAADRAHRLAVQHVRAHGPAADTDRAASRRRR